MQHQNQHDQTTFRQIEAQFLLRGVSGVTFAKSFPLLGSMVVGRTDTCDISIPDDGISRNHARIVARPGSILLEDMGSANGTFVNGKPIEKVLLKEGDEIRFDKIRFQIQSLNQVNDFLSEPYSQTASNNAQNPNPRKKKSPVKKIIMALLLIAVLAGLSIYFSPF